MLSARAFSIVKSFAKDHAAVKPPDPQAPLV
jgi:hypothetical protein